MRTYVRVATLTKSVQVDEGNFNDLFSVLLPPVPLQGRNGILCKICTNARKRESRARGSFHPERNSARTWNISEPLCQVSSARKRRARDSLFLSARLDRAAENLFLAGGVRGIIRNPDVSSRTCPSTYAGMQNPSSSFVPGRTLVANFTRNEEAR